MNILILSWRDIRHPLAGGAEQVVHEHAKGWIKGGHTVTMFSSRFINCLPEETIDGIKLIHKGDQYIGVKIFAFLYYLKNRNRFDLVVDEFHGMPFFSPLYVRKPKLAILQEVAKEVWFLSGFPWPLSWIIGIVGYVSEPLFFLFYKNVPFIVGSLSAKNDLVKMGIPQKNINIIPHGVIIKKLTITSSKEKTKTIIYLGALTKDKGIEDALKTFSYLAKEGNYNFWVIGKGGKAYEKNLLKLVKELKIKNKVKFWGFVKEDKKFELLSKAHVLINPSVREGWGLVNIEANTFGVPVVAYKSAGLIDSVKNGVSGLIIKKNTPEELAKGVIKILNDSKRYQNLRAGAISWSKNFSWDKSCQKSLSLFKKLSME
jgi:glycosyltransferase involved in cell wall biosynthesis